MSDKFKQRGIIALIALIVALAAAYTSNKNDSPLEQAAEAILNVGLGLPVGTIDVTKDND